MVTLKIRPDADNKGMLIYGYKFRPEFMANWVNQLGWKSKTSPFYKKMTASPEMEGFFYPEWEVLFVDWVNWCI